MPYFKQVFFVISFLAFYSNPLIKLSAFDKERFADFFFFFELSASVDLLVKDINFQKYDYSDFLILKYDFWNLKTLEKSMKDYQKQKMYLQIEQSFWKAFSTYQISIFLFNKDWQPNWFDLSINKLDIFFDFLEINYPKVSPLIIESFENFNLIQSCPSKKLPVNSNEDAQKSLKEFNHIDNQAEFKIPYVLFHIFYENLNHCNQLKINSKNRYKAHMLKFWLRFIFKNSYEVLLKKYNFNF